MSDITHVDIHGKPMTAKRKRMRRIYRRFKEFVDTYDKQTGYDYEDYDDVTFIKDMLYGIGVSIYPNRWKWASGFNNFLKHLKRKGITP